MASSSSTPLQSISIPRSERRTLPSPHVVYAIVVRLPVRTWTVYRRYSEFVELHRALSTGQIPPAPLPPKESVRRTWRGMASTLGLGGTSSGASTSASASTSDDPLLEERRQGLEQYLRAIVASPQDRWREAEAFRDFVELPRRESAKSLMPVGDGSVHDGGSDAGLSSKGGAGHRYVPGSYSAPTAQNTTRTLGSPPAHQPAVETPQTLQQSSSQLYASQQAQFDRQDAALDDLTAVLRRQRQMGMAINQELTEQTELLDGLDEEVRATQGRLTKNERDIKRLG